MSDTSALATIEQRILHVLENNQNKRGLTVEEIKRLAKIEDVDITRIYQALGRLMRQHEIRYERLATDRRRGTYLLITEDNDELDTLVEQQAARIKQAIPTSTQARKRVITAANHPLIPQLEFSKLIEDVLRDYVFIPSPKHFPKLLGIYIIFSGSDGNCLYIGQAQDLYKRCRHHWTWNEAMNKYHSAIAAYKLIDTEDVGETHRELIYEESLLIGLLRPKWNNVTPSLKNGLIPDTLEKFKQIHWNQLAEVPYEPFHPLMLTNDGYAVLKEIEVELSSGRVRTRWRKIIYDREYVKHALKNLADTVDNYFSTVHMDSKDSSNKLT